MSSLLRLETCIHDLKPTEIVALPVLLAMRCVALDCFTDGEFEFLDVGSGTGRPLMLTDRSGDCL